MADDIILNAGSGGDTIAADDDGTAKHQYVKVEFGADDTQTPVTAAAPLPIEPGTSVTFVVTNAGTFAVQAAQSGAWNINDISGTISLPTGASTAANQATGNTSLSTIAGTVIGTEQQTDIVTVGSVVDTKNSTTTPLAGAATYTGEATELVGYSAVCITIFADVDSAVDGVKFQFSTDNSNWDDEYLFDIDVSESDTRRFQFPVTARYFRLQYVNGAGAQSAFRVQTILHTANQLTSIHRLSDDMSSNRSATVVKAALFAQKAGTGDLTLIDATTAGNLKVSIEELSNGLDIGAGNAGAETQRVSISTDDVNLSAIKTAVEGTLTVGTHAVTQSGVWDITDITGTVSLPTGAATQATLANLDGNVTVCNTGAVVVASGTLTAVTSITNTVTVDGSGVTQPVSGTVTANLGTIADVATESTLSTIDGNASTTASNTGSTASNTGSIATDTSSIDGKITACDTGAVVLATGSAAIGKLTANSGVDIGDVDVTSIAAGTTTIGGTISQTSSSILYNGTTPETIGRASGVAASGTTAIISAVAARKFRILAMTLTATSATATNVYLATTTDTDVWGNAGNPIPMAMDADGDNIAGVVWPYNPAGYTETSTANEALNLILSAAQDIAWTITWIEVV